MVGHWYAVTSWALLVVGAGAGGWFTVSWGRRVRHPFTLASLDAGGWVYALLAVYLFQAGVYLTLGVPDPTRWQLGAARITLGVLLDGVLLARAYAWWALRQEYRSDADRPSPDPGRRR